MAKSDSFLLSRGEVLGAYGDEFYNRVTLVNNILPQTRNPCWVHQTASDIRDFSDEENVDCSCGHDFEGTEGCAQRQYVEGCLQQARGQHNKEERAELVSFGKTRCIALVMEDAVYLFGTIPICDHREGYDRPTDNTYHDYHVDIVCNDCKRSAAIAVPKLTDAIDALKEVLQDADALHDGLTLMEKFPVKTTDANGHKTIYEALALAQEDAKSVGMLEGLVAGSDSCGSLECTLDAKIIDSCNEFAEALIERCKTELVAVCSSLVGQVNSYSQPPLKVRLRWLKHYMALEYHVAYSADLSNCFFDEISGRYVPDLANENVVLHEFVQCSQVSLEGVENCFRLSLFRLQDYLSARSVFNKTGDFDAATHTVNDVFSNASCDVTPFWWNYYSFANTLGEGENVTENHAVKRLTRSQILKVHEDGASTPVARKSRNNLGYPLVTTHCVSSDHLGHSCGTTFEAQSEIRKELHESRSVESSNHSLNCKTTPTQSNRSLKSPLNEDTEEFFVHNCGRVCFCFKCLESISTLGRHFGASEFRQENHLCSAVFGESAYANELEELYNGCNGEDWDECKTASALRRSIRAAVEASSSLSRAIVSNEHSNAKNLLGQSIKVLNTALLSSLRLGDFIFSSRYSVEMRPEENIDSVKEFYDMGETMEGDGSDDSASSESTLRDIINNSFVVGNNPLSVLYSTFENDQYIQQDLEEPEDAPPLNSKAVVRRTPKRKPASPKMRHSINNVQNSSIESSSEFSGRQIRKCTRDSLNNNEVYVYDLSERNDAASESAVDEWYESDGSVRGSRRQRNNQSTSSLAEIYGNQDALIPMGPLPIGVYFDASRKLWRCQWRENGKFRTKGFSLGHYASLCEARRACIIFRCQVGNMPVQPEWLNPNYVQVSQLLSKKSTTSSAGASTPKKSRRKRKAHAGALEIDQIKATP